MEPTSTVEVFATIAHFHHVLGNQGGGESHPRQEREEECFGKNCSRHVEALLLPPKARCPESATVWLSRGCCWLPCECLFSSWHRRALSGLSSYQLSIPRLYLCPRAKLISELLDLMGHKKPVCCWCHVGTHTKPKAVLSCLLRYTTFMLFFLGNLL